MNNAFTLDRKLTTDQMSFMGVTYRNVGEVSFTGAEMTRGQEHSQSPPSVDDRSQSWKPGALCTDWPAECLPES